jgi:hypothetical protein
MESMTNYNGPNLEYLAARYIRYFLSYESIQNLEQDVTNPAEACRTKQALTGGHSDQIWQ